MKIFIAGPRKISILNKDIEERLQNISTNQFTVLVGDANGVDKAVQKYFHENSYGNVEVYAVNGSPRNNLGDWAIKSVEVKSQQKDFSYYTAKDKEMARDADYGFMIWNGQSKGTLNNMINLTKVCKKVLIHFLPDKKFYTIRSLEELKFFLVRCDKKTNDVFKELLGDFKEESVCIQSALDFEL